MTSSGAWSRCATAPATGAAPRNGAERSQAPRPGTAKKVRLAANGASFPGMPSLGGLRVFVLAALFVVLGAGLPRGEVEQGVAQAKERPNIVFILTDDLDAGSA